MDFSGLNTVKSMADAVTHCPKALDPFNWPQTPWFESHLGQVGGQSHRKINIQKTYSHKKNVQNKTEE